MTFDGIHRRQLLARIGAAAAATALPMSAARAQAPAPLERALIYAGFSPGGTVDVTARRVGEKLAGSYAKTVQVENRTGAGGQIALSALKAAPADGSVLLCTPMSMLGIYPHTYKKLPYDPVADFQPVSQAVQFDFGFAVGPAVPASVKTLPEFVAWCKANPTNANFGSPAAGSVPHFVAELFGKAAGLDLRHVPYRGTQPAIADMMGGQVSSVSGPVGEFLQHLAGGRARLIATSGAARNKFAPTVPTFAEQGFKDIVYGEWFGFFAPARLPADVLNRLSGAIRAALASQDVIDGLAQMGLEAKGSTPGDLAALLKRDTERWGPLVKQIGFTAES
jgi:tripartite-type tricarboxylate transporter receptor subunit TctC